MAKRGRPKGSKNKSTRVIPSKENIYIPKEGKYHCCMCGKSSVKQEFFPSCRSPFWKENSMNNPQRLTQLASWFFLKNNLHKYYPVIPVEIQKLLKW